MFWRADLCAASVFDMELHVFGCFSMHGVLEHVHVLHQCFSINSALSSSVVCAEGT